MTDNLLTIIRNGDFCRLNHLKWLDLNKNRITMIEENAFAGMVLLEQLYVLMARIPYFYDHFQKFV
jgi:hypothetical protein